MTTARTTRTATVARIGVIPFPIQSTVFRADLTPQWHSNRRPATTESDIDSLLGESRCTASATTRAGSVAGCLMSVDYFRISRDVHCDGRRRAERPATR
jgi:hypothetical protein